MSLAAPRIPPHSEEAEQSVLGGLLLDTKALDEVVDLLSEDDFYFEPHRLIYRGIRDLAKTGRKVDRVTLTDYLRTAVDPHRRGPRDSQPHLERIGGPDVLVNLEQNIPGAANVREYSLVVRENAIRRELIAAGCDTSAAAMNTGGHSLEEMLDLSEQRLLAIRMRTTKARASYLDITTVLGDLTSKMAISRDNPGQNRGLATGFSGFDELTTGLQAGDLVIVAGRPSMGKTSFAMGMAEHAALNLSKSVLVFSMEMSAEQLGYRLISSYSRVNHQHIREATFDKLESARMQAAMDHISQSKLLIDETGGLSPMDLRSRARRVAATHGIDLVVVDYIQLMQIPGSENRTNEISEISRSLKALAKELNCPIVALSQLNRGVENRENKRPRMADLRESGGIEQDADLIAFIYRDEVYNESSPDKGTAEIIIAKQRNGPTGMVRTAFLGQFTRFDNLDVLAPQGY